MIRRRMVPVMLVSGDSDIKYHMALYDSTCVLAPYHVMFCILWRALVAWKTPAMPCQKPAKLGGTELALNIVDADINALRRLTRPGRARSEETLKLISAIESLKPDKAKALVLETGDTIPALRSKLGYAARAAGVKLRTASDGAKLIFALQKKGSAPVQNREGAAERKELVRSGAMQLADSGKQEISAEDVLEVLPQDDQIFSMARPATVVGAVLRSMSEFTRVSKNRFQLKS